VKRKTLVPSTSAPNRNLTVPTVATHLAMLSRQCNCERGVKILSVQLNLCETLGNIIHLVMRHGNKANFSTLWLN
jgi:hypothetical protein